jgi:hypothetical protein
MAMSSVTESLADGGVGGEQLGLPDAGAGGEQLGLSEAPPASFGEPLGDPEDAPLDDAEEPPAVEAEEPPPELVGCDVPLEDMPLATPAPPSSPPAPPLDVPEQAPIPPPTLRTSHDKTRGMGFDAAAILRFLEVAVAQQRPFRHGFTQGVGLHPRRSRRRKPTKGSTVLEDSEGAFVHLHGAVLLALEHDSGPRSGNQRTH